MSPRARGPLLAGWTALLVAVALLVAACGSDGSAETPVETAAAPSSASPNVTVSPSAASPAETAGQQAVEAYLGMWRDMATAATTSDWRSPLLARHATGAALQVITGSLYADYRNGHITKGVPENSPVISSVDPPDDPTTVLISDCGDSTNWLKYRIDTGQLVDDEPGGRQAITAEVKKQADGAWRVTRFAVEGVGTC